MAQKSYEVAYNLWSKSPSDETLMGRALKAHMDALKFRCDYGAETFPYYLPTTECINKFVGIALPVVSFYNLHTRQPDHFDPRKIDAITIHSILLQAISQNTIECPLKMGVPFFCDSAALEPNTLCVWNHQHGTSECLVDVLERYFELKSS